MDMQQQIAIPRAEQSLSLHEIFLTPEFAILVLASWCILEAIHKAFPRARASRAWWHALPFAPLVVGVCLAFIPIAAAPSATWADRVLIGIVAGTVAVTGRKAIKRQISEKFFGGARETDPPRESR